MEKSTKVILGLGVLAVAYVIYKKKIAPSTVSTVKKAAAPVVEKVTTPDELFKPQYPNGLKEGDYILIGSDPTAYLLKDGKRLPITYDWFMRYAADKWDSIIRIEPVVGLDIPVGDTLVV